MGARRECRLALDMADQNQDSDSPVSGSGLILRYDCCWAFAVRQLLSNPDVRTALVERQYLVACCRTRNAASWDRAVAR